MLMMPDEIAHPDLIQRIRADIHRPISVGVRRVNLAIEPIFVLGRARIDPEAHEFTIAGSPTRMQPRTLKVLIVLHEKHGRVVSRAELIDRCWDARIVGNDVIDRCISLLRSFPAQSGGFKIETISGAGYRLVESARTAKLKLRPGLCMVGGTVAAFTALLSASPLVERPLPTHPCSPSFAAFALGSAAGPNNASRMSRRPSGGREVGKRSAGSGRDRAVNSRSLGKFVGRSASRIVLV
jgi:DNA-binding winged helix-turn-helix (wHTH) protein